jgi:phosphoserine phosphatase
MTTPSSDSASAMASADLPLAVGPAMTPTMGLSLVATLIGRLSDADLAAARDAVRDAGGEPGAARWLDAGEAAELTLTAAAAPPLRAVLEAALPLADIVVQAADGHGVKRLLIADMDSTMIQCECIDELADYAGLKAEVAAVTEAAMRGELDFGQALDARVALLAGLDAGVIDRCRRERVRLTPGATTLIGTMRAHGAYTLLVSGGFTAFTGPVAAEIGFDEQRANTLLVADGRLTGAVAKPIVDAAAKRAALIEAAAARGLQRHPDDRSRRPRHRLPRQAQGRRRGRRPCPPWRPDGAALGARPAARRLDARLTEGHEGHAAPGRGRGVCPRFVRSFYRDKAA